MGAIRDFFFPNTAPSKISDVQAALTPVQIQDSIYQIMGGSTTTTRPTAMSVPAVARARNIICGTIGSLPLTTFNRITGAYVDPHRVINQPDPRVAGFVIYTWLAEDIFMYGVGYGQVLEMYSTTDGGRVRSWTRISPDRVTVETDAMNNNITGYRVDGMAVPNIGVGSLIRFDGGDEGLLNRAGKTINAAMALESAALNYAKDPMPTLALKSTGTNLPAEELARACGIPAYFLSAETTSMTYSNAVSERRSLVDFSLRPILKAIEERLSLPDFVPNPVMVRFDLDDFLRGNALERAQVYEILNRIGAMSVEQIQREEDLIPNEN